MIRINGKQVDVLYPATGYDDLWRKTLLGRAVTSKEWVRIKSDEEYRVGGLSPFENLDISYKILIEHNGSSSGPK